LSPSLTDAAARLACLALLPALAFGIWSSARLARADADFRLNTPESLARAVQLEPDDAAQHQLLAEHLESEGLDPLPNREAAARLSPRESRYQIDLGILAEFRADNAAAEKHYLQAASVDRMFAPRQALAGFYFRRHDAPRFWRWAKEALAMAHDDVSPVFRICLLMSDDPESVRRILPATNYMRSQYLQFLLADGHADAAPPIAHDLAEHAGPDETGTLLDYWYFAISHDPRSALDVWNILCRRGQLPFSPLNPAEGVIVTNGDFRAPPTERGFDWHLSRSDGVSITNAPNGSGLGVELTGDARSVDSAGAGPHLPDRLPLQRRRGRRFGEPDLGPGLVCGGSGRSQASRPLGRPEGRHRRTQRAHGIRDGRRGCRRSLAAVSAGTGHRPPRREADPAGGFGQP
jgi:hypothetical protein